MVLPFRSAESRKDSVPSLMVSAKRAESQTNNNADPTTRQKDSILPKSIRYKRKKRRLRQPFFLPEENLRPEDRPLPQDRLLYQGAPQTSQARPLPQCQPDRERSITRSQTARNVLGVITADAKVEKSYASRNEKKEVAKGNSGMVDILTEEQHEILRESFSHKISEGISDMKGLLRELPSSWMSSFGPLIDALKEARLSHGMTIHRHNTRLNRSDNREADARCKIVFEDMEDFWRLKAQEANTGDLRKNAVALAQLCGRTLRSQPSRKKRPKAKPVRMESLGGANRSKTTMKSGTTAVVDEQEPLLLSEVANMSGNNGQVLQSWSYEPTRLAKPLGDCDVLGHICLSEAHMDHDEDFAILLSTLDIKDDEYGGTGGSVHDGSFPSRKTNLQALLTDRVIPACDQYLQALQFFENAGSSRWSDNARPRGMSGKEIQRFEQLKTRALSMLSKVISRRTTVEALKHKALARVEELQQSLNHADQMLSSVREG